ncbi:MAG: hypothetical protein AAGD05_10615, partial [Bacteroidota bacterium]
ANGCTASASLTLNNPPELNVSTAISTQVTCAGFSDGVAMATGTGGTGSLTYEWSNGENSTTATNLSAGATYTVSVSDDNGCLVTANVIMNDPVALNINVNTSNDPSLCEGSDGSIVLSGSGGSGTYEYRMGLTGSWQSSGTFSGLSAGTYDFYMRNSGGTCPMGPVSVTLDDPIPSSCPITPPADPLTACNADISIPFSVNPSPDASGYFWVAPTGMLIVSGQGTTAITINANGVAPGNYDVCVTTTSNCGSSAPCCFSFDVVTCIEICDNGVDDDNNGLTDCDDPACSTIADINLPAPTCTEDVVSFTAADGGSGSTYAWDFGAGASPATATGIGPHNVTYSTCGIKNIDLVVTRGTCVANDSKNLTISDTQVPNWDINPSALVLECDASFNPTDTINHWLNNTGGGTASDLCGNVVISHDYVSLNTGACGGTGLTIVTFTATDQCGNTAEAQANIVVQDTTDPTFTVPADTTLYLDLSCGIDTSTTSIGTVLDAGDLCSGAGVLTIVYTDDLSNITGCSSTGTILRTWMVTDDCGNATAQTQTISVLDTLAPAFLVPADTVLYLDVFCQVDTTIASTGDVMGETNGCVSSQATYTDDLSNLTGCNTTGVLIRTWTLSDDCGNTTTQTQTITIRDTLAPSFTVPADITLIRDLDCQVDLTTATTGEVTDESDACSTGLSASFVDDTSGLTGCNNTGTIVRTWSLSDDCGNTTTQTQTITIIDNLAPAFVVPNDTTLYLDLNCLVDTTITSIGDVLGETNSCVSSEATYVDDLSGLTDCNGTGVLRRVWSLSDDCGNTTLQTQTITIVDNLAPVFVVPNDTTLYLDLNCLVDTMITSIGDVLGETNSCVSSEATYVDDLSGLTGCNGTGVLRRVWSLS